MASEVWKVRVECWFRKTQLGKAEKCYQTALVHASDSVEAMEDGKAFIEDNAPSDVLWVQFDVLEATRVDLPMLI